MSSSPILINHLGRPTKHRYSVALRVYDPLEYKYFYYPMFTCMTTLSLRRFGGPLDYETMLQLGYSLEAVIDNGGVVC